MDCRLGLRYGMVWCCYVCVCCDSGFFEEIAGPGIMLGGYLRILGASSVQLCCTLSIYADIANPDFLGCCCRTWISFVISRFDEEQRQPSSVSAWPACPKTLNGAPFLGAGGVDTICTAVCQAAVTATPCVGCVVWSY